MNKWVYSFGPETTEGSAGMRALLGGKGSNLAEMSKLKLSVPPGFTLSTETCAYYYSHEKTFPSDLVGQVKTALKEVERLLGSRFGDEENPLLLSVRSGARTSMPGMMDTVLNLGLNDQTIEAFAEKIQDRRCAYDSYRRFIQMYSNVVLKMDHGRFEEILEDYKQEREISLDAGMEDHDWVEIVGRYKLGVLDHLGQPFPQDLDEQLWNAIGAVFVSWMSPRAITYRQLHHIPESWGTAVNVQAMVFGNMGGVSGTGVVFTRDPSSGENVFYGEFLKNAQGEDVVAGLRTPQMLTESARSATGSDIPSLEGLMPSVFQELKTICQRLESHYRDMQDIEFTIQNGRLWILQTRAGKRTMQAAVKIAIEMVKEGLISKEEAVLRIEPEGLSQLLHPTLDLNAVRDVLTVGLPASPGAAVGEIVFSADEAKVLKEKGRSVILVRVETSPDDIHGMHAASGILTMRGGMTSHAAVVARGMGRPCVSGAGELKIDYRAGTMSIGNEVLRRGDVITIDGSTGQVLRGCMEMNRMEISGAFSELISWANEFRSLGVRSNADTPQEARVAHSFGAEGIGLCRTEHMFFNNERILVMREMILASDEESRRKALNKLLPMQRSDFEILFEIMHDLPVTIRLLDPPLHEFLPQGEARIKEVAFQLGCDVEMLFRRVNELSEVNPMLGHRGCRLAITYPEITEMQTRAILEAATSVYKKTEISPNVEIMLPLILGRAEFDFLSSCIRQVAAEVESETGITISYKIGTMVELPRACLRAGEISENAAFLSFGTNDLTQTCMGVSRDDTARFLSAYVEKKLLNGDPFKSIDEEGVGELMRIGVERGRKVKPDIKIGICGEHGGDPTSIHFCHKIGINYVSCSPFRVPIAQLAAAHAALRNTHVSDKKE
ncbi:MAG: pyruvate, phosphate dikinase [Alphaproteobacteria bacterium]|nr:pyruvate, phosphate dikinase [Alphaproteobacteria bacterium]